jgi:membrane protease YdiL (CAAX protease family)
MTASTGSRDPVRRIAIPVLFVAPSALIVCAAAVRPLRLPALAVLAVGLVLARRSADPRIRAAWAAPLPVAVLLALALVPEPSSAGGAAACTDPLPPRMLRRVFEMVAVLLTVAAVGLLSSSPRDALRLRRPSGRVAVLSIGLFLVATPVAVVVGPALAEPFFGPVGFAIPGPLVLVPALVFALANSVEEEVAYRGAWLGWGERSLGPLLALGSQGLAFGLAHAGTDYTGPALPVVAAMVAGGIVAGVIARRTDSLALPIALHAAADVPLFLAAICRTG